MIINAAVLWIPADHVDGQYIRSSVILHKPFQVDLKFFCVQRLTGRMETMSMERNVTSDYEYSNAFPFEKDFDQWHYKRWTEENWVRAHFTQKSKRRMGWLCVVRDILA